MIVQTIPIPQALTLHPLPLSSSSFSPFGNVIANPSPSSTPQTTTVSSIAADPLLRSHGAISANQGTAIQYKQLGAHGLRNLYDQAPSGKVASGRITMFVCAARAEISTSPGAASKEEKEEAGRAKNSIPITILERHPFTTQTFIPLTANAKKQYLVVVAPSAPPGNPDAALPAPERNQNHLLPGRGLPDVAKLRAFIATGEQAVTYGAGTWHAPMVALGPAGTTVDFVVVQFANDVAVEDCQEVVLEGREEEGIRIEVGLPPRMEVARL
ncbi:ureidoglycolate hydrolase [Pseudomassariella vexata]|uniref:Ureidoglycolate hydrolase n=1 Tax=Pseudomassariella vexata TaxID=1141098 RepID=A0A1Y2EB10_9PEZI|nr:ureidoglycolate hydrolase [Pseudomassariella vexata]ORY68763.1 ureidoglycolate hydrolase [Pseudomassariella vexata]